MRLARLLKLSHYTTALEDLVSAIYSERQAFVAALYLMVVALFLSSSLIYVAEHDAQPDAFPSIPETMWWSIVTLTTVGYGDLFPTSAAARIFNIFYILVGLSVVATCVGAIVAWAEAEARNRYGDKEKMQKNVKDLTYSLLRHVVALTFILGVGAVWYTVVENASVLDGIYWATITSASPHSPATRARDARMAHNNVDVVRRRRFDCGLRRLPNRRSDPHLQLLLYRRRSLRP